MPDIATGVTDFFTYTDRITGIIYVTWVDDSGAVWLAKLAPDGTKLDFLSGATEKQVSTIEATSVSITVKNSILCLKYIDAADNALKQLFSHDTGETWGSTW